MQAYSFITIFVISLAVSFLSTPIFIKLANKLNIVDLPSARKIHIHATPLLGGLAIYLGVITGFLLNIKTLNSLLPVLLGGTIILVVGIINDIKELNVQVRLFFQLIAALILIFSGNSISFFPKNLWGYIASITFTLIWVIGVTNAYNYLDGLDGLLTGSVIINLLCFAVILFHSGQLPLAKLSLIIMASCLGFLPFNIKNAKIFLGDAGSTFLGFVLSGIALMGNWADDSFVKVSIPILVLGVAIFDMIFTTIIRIREEKVKTVIEWLKYAGKDHFHHYLLDLGLPHFVAVVFIYFVTLSLGISAFLISNDHVLEALLSFVQAFIIFSVIAILIVAGKKNRERHPKSLS